MPPKLFWCGKPHMAFPEPENCAGRIFDKKKLRRCRCADIFLNPEAREGFRSTNENKTYALKPSKWRTCGSTF